MQRNDMPSKKRLSPLTGLVIAILCVATSPLLTRGTQGAPAAVAAWRLGIASAILLSVPGALRGINRTGAKWGIPAAVFLAMHFGAWIASMRLLPLSVSVILVSCHPLFVMPARWAFRGERPTRAEVVGAVVALVGLVVMQGAIGTTRSGSAAGVALALFGAFCLAAYLLLGAEARRTMSARSFTLFVYALSAVLLTAWTLVRREPLLPPSPQEWYLYAALAILPTISGHGLFAWAVGHVRPVVVSVSFLGEPVIASLLAIPIFGEIPAPRIVLGGAILLVGLAVVAAHADRKTVMESTPDM
jgi:drug/metabolite transporter (DMT)-like permease